MLKLIAEIAEWNVSSNGGFTGYTKEGYAMVQINQWYSGKGPYYQISCVRTVIKSIHESKHKTLKEAKLCVVNTIKVINRKRKIDNILKEL